MAFGDRPADPVVVRPADPPVERWSAAVALGARGRYGAARALLDTLRLDPATPSALRAHAAVTRASHLRQLGGHLAARRWDGVGLALATAALAGSDTHGPVPVDPGAGDPVPADPGVDGPVPGGPGAGDPGAGGPGAGGPHPGGPHPGAPHPGGPHSSGLHSNSPHSNSPHAERASETVGADARAARVDALLGLAADALGLGDLALSARLLAAAEPAAREHPSWRPLVRWRWVRAELALAWDEPEQAVGLARSAGACSRTAGAVRHELKSDLIQTVARRCAGDDTDGVRCSLERLAERAVVARLRSLEWPTRSVLGELLSGVDATAARTHAARVRDLLAWILRSTDPYGRSVADRSPWVSDVSAG